jgi:hypothetical protein
MPNFNLEFANISNSNQDWQLSTGQAFELAPNQARGFPVTVIEDVAENGRVEKPILGQGKTGPFDARRLQAGKE